MEKTEQENIYLKGENQKINKALDTLKKSANKLLDVEHEKEELMNQNKLLLKNIEVLKVVLHFYRPLIALGSFLVRA